MTTWYAVMADRDDNDWGYGSHDLAEAKQMLKDAEVMGLLVFVVLLDLSDVSHHCLHTVAIPANSCMSVYIILFCIIPCVAG